MGATELTLKMIWKLGVVAVLFIFSLVVYTLVFYKEHPGNPHRSKVTKHTLKFNKDILMLNKHISTEHDIDCSYIHDIIRTRNDLSLQLNNMRRIIGQMQCEVIIIVVCSFVLFLLAIAFLFVFDIRILITPLVSSNCS
jgi:hypothetical protein